MKQIAVAGKGGTGKTTFVALLIRYLLEKNKTPILAVDADPNANLNETLGMELPVETVSQLIERTKELHGIPEGMDQLTYIEYKLNAALVESSKVDLLVMGGPEGPGCYCFPNNVLRKYLDGLGKNYQYVVMDNEAGLEHISRRTTHDVDILFIISDNSARSIRSAGRVRHILDSIKTKVKQVVLVVTKVQNQDLLLLQDEIEKTGITLAGVIPYDGQITEYDVSGKPLFDLPEDSLAYKAVNCILDTIQI